MREIELKAKVIDPEAVAARLAEFMSLDGEFEKQDEYWAIELPTLTSGTRLFRLRLRKDSGRNLVTFKEKTYRADMEVNEEIEFGVDDEKSFRAILERMGAKLLYEKRKKGSRWRGEGGLQAELVHVDGLGDFLEVELLFEECTAPCVEETRNKLLRVVELCGLSGEDLESRPYSQLLGYSIVDGR